MTVLLSTCLRSWCQSLNDAIPLRGVNNNLDSSKVAIIEVDLLRKANIKLIERKMLIEVCNQQDTIIAFKDSYILEQERIIKDFQNKVLQTNEINTELSRSLDKQKKITYIVGGVAGAALMTTVVLILVK